MAQCPWPAGSAAPTQVPQTVLILGEGASLMVSQGGELWLHKGTWKVLGTDLGAPLIRQVRTRVKIEASVRRQKGSLINSQRY
jgi:hypothetical protein